jgi:hypothetical protein
LRLAWPNNLRNFISKIARVKWAAGVLQAVERLLCKHKALSSNPSPTKKKKKKKREPVWGKKGGLWTWVTDPAPSKKESVSPQGEERPHTHTHPLLRRNWEVRPPAF